MSAIRMKALGTDPLVSPEKLHSQGATKNLVYSSVCAYMAALSFGYMIGYSSPALPLMTKDGTLDETGASWFASIATLGALAGCPFAGWAVEKYGRKGALSITALPFTVGWLLLTVGADEKIIYFGRLLTGTASGMVTVVAPMYIAETSTKELRGMLGSGIQLWITIGILLVYLLGMVVSWKLLALLGVIPAALGFIMTQRIPETPRFYLMFGKKAEAIRSLEWLRPWNVDAEEECRDIQEGLESDESIGWKEFLKPELSSPLLVAAGLMLMQQLTGINVVMFYTVSIFESAGLKDTGSLATVAIGAVQVVATVFSCILMDRAGRRALLFISGTGMCVACFTFGYYYYRKLTAVDGGDMAWLAVCSLVVYIVAFSLGWGPCPMLVMSEVFPVKARGRASAIATFVSWGSAFVVTKQFHSLQLMFGQHGVFWLYSAACALSLVFVWKMVPETKGKSLEDIGLYFLGRAERGI